MDVNSKVSFVRNLYQISTDTSGGFRDVEADFTGFPRRKLSLNKKTIVGLTSNSSIFCTGVLPATCPTTNDTKVVCPTVTDTNHAANCSCECSGHHTICDICYTINDPQCATGTCPPNEPLFSDAAVCTIVGGTVGCYNPG